MDIDAVLGQAIARLQSGQLAMAESALQQILQRQSEHADANHLLGVIALQRGHYPQAIECIRRALQSQPKTGMFHSNLAHALRADGQLQAALTACERAIQLGPPLAETFFTYGSLLQQMGRAAAALTAYQRALAIRPDYVEAQYQCATLLLAAGHAEAAENSLRQVLRYNPKHAAAHNNLAVLLVNTGRLQAGLAASEKALQLQPDYAQAHNCRADALRRLGRLSAALTAIERALALQPEAADAHYNHANILLEMGRIRDAEASYQRALRLRPDDAHLHSNVLFVQAAQARLPPQAMLQALREWDQVHGQAGRQASLSRPVSLSHPARHGNAERRLRIGYVSPHLRAHVVSYFFEPLLAAHDRQRFEIYCYACNLEARADAVARRLQGMAEHWQFVGDLDDAQLAQRICDDQIDVLVDLAGHTTRNRLRVFTYRPAPVQVTYLGFFNSTGLAAMDYWLTDTVLHPPDTTECSTETLYRLPRCWVCYRPPPQAPALTPCPNQDARVVFGVFNNLSKLSTATWATWQALLQRVPGSRLLLMATALADSELAQALLERLAEQGIEPERIILRQGGDYARYFATFAEVDIVLDPFPRTGGTTTAEALWMGLPVISLAGQRYVERISASTLTAVGLTELIAHDTQDYLDKAVQLAQDPARRAVLRSQLRARMAQSPLCDAADLARAVEAAYSEMWERRLAAGP